MGEKGESGEKCGDEEGTTCERREGEECACEREAIERRNFLPCVRMRERSGRKEKGEDQS